MASLANMDVRIYAMEKGVRMWQLANELGYKHENNLSRKMRTELTKAEKEKFKLAIKNISNGGNKNE